MVKPTGAQFEQGKLFEYTPRPHTTPAEHVSEGAKRFVAEQGGEYKLPSPDLQNDPRRGLLRAIAYERAPEVDESAKPAYDAFRRDLSSQFDFMTGHAPGGLGLTHEVTDYDPYDSPAAMVEDVRTNRRIRSMATKVTGGHPYLTDEENDRFRAVHDTFGHAGPGSSFTRNGEEIAYQSHAQMFSPEALPALRAETRGQNSYMIYRNAGEFGPQKVAGLPSDKELRR